MHSLATRVIWSPLIVSKPDSIGTNTAEGNGLKLELKEGYILRKRSHGNYEVGKKKKCKAKTNSEFAVKKSTA